MAAQETRTKSGKYRAVFMERIGGGFGKSDAQNVAVTRANKPFSTHHSKT